MTPSGGGSAWDRAKQARRRGRAGRCGCCCSVVGIYFWVWLTIAAIYFLATWPPEPMGGTHEELEVAFNKSVVGACTVDANTTCNAAHRSVWRQFAAIVRGLGSEGELSSGGQARARTCGATNGSMPESDVCSTCTCKRLESIAASPAWEKCGVGSVLAAVTDQQARVAALQQADDRFGRLADTGSLMQGLASSDACRGCDRAQCAMGSATEASPPVGPCDVDACSPMCVQMREQFDSASNVVPVECRSAAKQAEMDDLEIRYRSQRECAGCCALGEGQGCSQALRPDRSAATCPPQCPDSACEDLSSFYSNLSTTFNECPDQLPPDLRVALAEGSLQPVLFSQFQSPRSSLNLTDLGAPPS